MSSPQRLDAIRYRLREARRHQTDADYELQQAEASARAAGDTQGQRELKSAREAVGAAADEVERVADHFGREQ